MKLYKVKKVIDAVSIITIILSYCFTLCFYVILCIKNPSWAWGAPLALIYFGSVGFSLYINDRYEWVDPWDADDWDVQKKLIISENKKLKKIIDKQNKLKYVKVL